MNYARDRFWSGNKVVTEIPDLLDKIEKSKDKLSSTSFLEKAPQKIIEIENKKLVDFNERLTAEIDRVLTELNLDKNTANWYIQAIREAEYLKLNHIGYISIARLNVLHRKINMNEYTKVIYADITPIDYDRLYFEYINHNLYYYIKIVDNFWEIYNFEPDEYYQKNMNTNQLINNDHVVITLRKPYLDGDTVKYKPVKFTYDCYKNNPFVCLFKDNKGLDDIFGIERNTAWLSLDDDKRQDRIFANSIESYYFGTNNSEVLCGFANDIVNISILRNGRELKRPKLKTGDTIWLKNIKTKSIQKLELVDYDKRNTNLTNSQMYVNYTPTGTCNQYSAYKFLKLFETSNNPLFAKVKLVRHIKKNDTLPKFEDQYMFRTNKTWDPESIRIISKVFIQKRQYKFLKDYLYNILENKRGVNNSFDLKLIDDYITQLKRYV